MNKIRVAVVDDHPLYREGVVIVLGRHEDIEVVGQGECAEDAIRIAREQRPDVIVLDMNMPGGGVHAAETIAADQPTTRVLLLSVEADAEKVCDVMHSAAREYLLKEAGGAQVVQIVRMIHEGGTYVEPSLAGDVLAQVGRRSEQSVQEKPSLSPRQEQIFELVGKGLSNKEVANELNLTHGTIKRYMTILFDKLQVRNRTEVALIANRRTMIKVRDVVGVRSWPAACGAISARRSRTCYRRTAGNVGLVTDAIPTDGDLIKRPGCQQPGLVRCGSL
jgi:DNA-binding NarL/FixJ family response regulator